MIIGPDVSFYQNDKETPKGIDFEKMREAGVRLLVVTRYYLRWCSKDETRLRNGACFFSG